MMRQSGLSQIRAALEADTIMRWRGLSVLWLLAVACLLMLAIGIAILAAPVPSFHASAG